MAKITFIVENDAGEILDNVAAEMTDAALMASIAAVCDAHCYSEAKASAEAAGEAAVSEVRYFSWMIRRWVEKQVDRYVAKMGADQALAQSAALKATVVIPENTGE